MAALLARKILSCSTPGGISLRSYQIVCFLFPYLLSNGNGRLKPCGFCSVASRRSSDTARHLFEEFSKPQNLRNEEELRCIGKILTPEAVEDVLKGLKGWRRAHEFFVWSSRQERYKHNCYTYNAMACILSRAQRADPLKSLAKEVVEKRCYMTPGALGFLIRCLGDQGLVEEANFLVDNAEIMGCFPNSYTYNCLLEGLARTGRVDLVESRLADMLVLGMRIDKFTMTPVLKAYCNSGKFDRALGVFEEILRKGWADEHVFTLLLVSLSKGGEVEKAWELLERMERRSMNLNEKTFCILTHGLIKEGDFSRALALFGKMKESGFKGDLALYSALISKLCEERELDKALQFYSEMKENEILPDASLVSKMISSLCGAGDFIAARRILEVDGEGVGLGSLVLLYNGVLQGLVNHGLVESAHSLVYLMMGNCKETAEVPQNQFSFKRMVQPNADSFCIVVCGLCKAEKLETAQKLVDNMSASGYKGNLLMYNDLISALCSVHRLQESVDLLEKFPELGLEPSQFTHNSIFGCLCDMEDAQGAADFLKIMRKHGHAPWIKHCTLLVKKLCKVGNSQDACKFLDEMIEVGFVPDMITYTALINGLCHERDVDRALEVFRTVSSEWYLPDVVAHNIIISGFCNAGRLEEAQEILKEMVDKGLLPSVVTSNVMMNAWCKHGNLDLALRSFSEIDNDELRSPTVVSFTILIHGLLCANKPNDALAYWTKMREKGCSPNRISYSALIHGLCSCGMPDAALAYFDEMDGEGIEPDVSIFIIFLHSLALKGKSVEAFRILHKMIQKFEFSSPVGKNYERLRDSLRELYRDMHTSSDLVRLIEEGRIPVFHSVDMIVGQTS
ncbi:tetratricopeptide repeat (TPR)-like superfamily protein [Wolffia australiana]